MKWSLPVFYLGGTRRGTDAVFTSGWLTGTSGLHDGWGKAGDILQSWKLKRRE
ncbi:hypothetical protein IWQ51_004629 [Labrenzia sp. EL_142]|nr:hypothetical protein [Labrenzia sp. EL_142]